MNQIKIGKFIAQCRKENNLTQAALAERLNITDRAVSKWETGKCMPDAAIIPDVCILLGISVSELFSGERLESNNQAQKTDTVLLRLKAQNEAIGKAARFAYGTTLILLLACVLFDFCLHGAQHAVSTPAFFLMSATSVVYLLIYLRETVKSAVHNPDP